MSNVDIKYLNKDYTDFKAALIEYAKAYYPQVYNDFTTASPGSMFIEMAAYVGDVLSFYLDNQIQETFLQYARQPSSLYALAYMLGYKPKLTSAATVDLDVYQLLPAKLAPSGGTYVPDYDYALVIQEGAQVASTQGSGVNFYIPEAVNFAVSGSDDRTTVSIYSVNNSTGDPTYYLIKKTVKAISGTVQTATFSFNTPVRFDTRTLTDTSIVEILSVVDSDGNKWYEVPYLAQDTILKAAANLEGVVPNYTVTNPQIPYFLQVEKIPRRFVTRVQPDNTLQLQFGPGVNTVADEAVVFNPNKVGIGLLDGLTKLNTAYDPTNFTTTYTYGLAPSNTELTITYLSGGGVSANVAANTITSPLSIDADFYIGAAPNTELGEVIKNSVLINNPAPARGGGDGDTVEEIRMNTLLQFPTQLRAVTMQDYIAFTYSMPGKFGKIAKAYGNKDSIVYTNITQQVPGVVDPYTITLYILTTNALGQLVEAPTVLKENLKTYLSQYRMLTDTLYIRDAYVINIGVSFEVILQPNYAAREVLSKCITALQNHFNTDNWQINQPIIYSTIYSILDRVEGVQTVKSVKIINKYGETNGYSPYAYDIQAATLNGVIYPSLDPSIFEVRYPNTDIKGKVVTY